LIGTTDGAGVILHNVLPLQVCFAFDLPPNHQPAEVLDFWPGTIAPNELGEVSRVP
jgi:hypothetical protein